VETQFEKNHGEGERIHYFHDVIVNSVDLEL